MHSHTNCKLNGGKNGAEISDGEYVLMVKTITSHSIGQADNVFLELGCFDGFGIGAICIGIILLGCWHQIILGLFAL